MEGLDLRDHLASILDLHFLTTFSFDPQIQHTVPCGGVLSQEPTDELQMLSFSGGN